jgi:hypothetical protein
MFGTARSIAAYASLQSARQVRALWPGKSAQLVKTQLEVAFEHCTFHMHTFLEPSGSTHRVQTLLLDAAVCQNWCTGAGQVLTGLDDITSCQN